MNAEPVLTTADFERLSWHDNLIYGWSFRAADPQTGDWRSEVAFDIDHILDWLCGADGRVRFRVAPARLVFTDVADFGCALDWGEGSGGLQLPSIDRIERGPVPSPPGLDLWRWVLRLNAPRNGSLSFVASGFVQTLLAEPLLLDEQWIAPSRRRQLVAAGAAPAGAP